MGTVYTLPVVTMNTLTTNGLYVCDRITVGNKVYVGANIPNVKFTYDFNPNTNDSGFCSACENPYRFYWSWAGTATEYDGVLNAWASYGMRAGIYARALGTGAGYSNNPQIDYYERANGPSGAPYSIEALIQEFPLTLYPITYRLTNCTGNGPSEATVGETVNVDFTFPSGYGIVNPSSDVYVTNNGVVVSSSYVNGRLTFTMPDPS